MIKGLNKKIFLIMILVITLLIFGSVSFARDNNSPTGRIKIAGATILKDGKQAVSSRNVTLEIYAYDADPGVSRIALVNENNMTPIDWISWTDSSLTATGVSNTKRKSWQLSPNDGMKTVYLLVEDGDGNTTVTYNDAYRYYITYNLKGGSNGPSQGAKEVGKPYTISSTVPVRTNYDFLGWDTSSAGTKADYVGGDKYYKNADITLYAYWQPHYTIVFNGNGNTGGSTANQGMTYSIAQNLRANGFTKTGYLFNKWNTKANGTGTNYNNQQSVNNLTSTPGGTFNLYAQWNPITYTIAYNQGVATSGTLPSNHTGVKYDQNVTLGTNSMNKSNTNLGTVTFNYNYTGSSNTTSTAYTTYSRNGWSTSSSGAKVYDNGQSVKNLTATNGATVNLYPYFSSTAHSATFPTPTRTGYTFVGWYTASSGGSKVTSYTGSSNVTYYAHWTDEEAPSSPTITATGNVGENGWFKGDSQIESVTDDDFVTVKISQGSDNGSGVQKTTYTLSGATVKSETEIANNGTFVISNQGKTTVTAYTYDNAGNKSGSATKDIYLDYTSPTIEDIDVWGWYNSSIRSDGATTTLNLSPSDSGGSGLWKATYSMVAGGSTLKGNTDTDLDANNYCTITVPPSSNKIAFTIKVKDKAGNYSWERGANNFALCIAIAQGYNYYLLRSPEYPTGMKNWFKVGEDPGAGMAWIYYGIVFSVEGDSHNYGDYDFVEKLYQSILGRPSEPGGFDHWINRLQSTDPNVHRTRVQVVNDGFMKSPEYINIKNAWGFILDTYPIQTGDSIPNVPPSDGGHSHHLVRYVPMNGNQHKVFCECGYSEVEAHRWIITKTGVGYDSSGRPVPLTFKECSKCHIHIATAS